MGTDDTHDVGMGPAQEPSATPDPASVSAEQPLLIVPATPVPALLDLAPTVATPMADAPVRTDMPTQVLPAVPVAVPIAHETQTPMHLPPDAPDRPSRPPVWPYVAAVVALLAGGIVGFFIGAAAGEDDDTSSSSATSAPTATVVDEPLVGGPAVDATLDMLLVRTKADGEYESPSEYAQLDEITAIDNARATQELQAQVDLLNAARDDASGLTEQIAELESVVADVTAERDALLIAASTDGDDAGQIQDELDAANAAIDELTADLADANADLEAANATIVERDVAITTLQGQLDTANRTLTDLNVEKIPSYVNGDVAKARTDAATNRWILIEQPTVSASAPVGVVLDQSPPANSNMISGSVVYLEVAARS